MPWAVERGFAETQRGRGRASPEHLDSGSEMRAGFWPCGDGQGMEKGKGKASAVLRRTPLLFFFFYLFFLGDFIFFIRPPWVAERAGRQRCGLRKRKWVFYGAEIEQEARKQANEPHCNRALGHGTGSDRIRYRQQENSPPLRRDSRGDLRAGTGGAEMGCSSSPPRADIPCPSRSLFPMANPTTDQRKQLLGASSAPLQPKARAQLGPCPRILAADGPSRHNSCLGDAVKPAADKSHPGALVSRKM